jgi:pimeloyl-ACP methyl ester carboxylesterase
MATPQNSIILFSHGFGIRKDNLGLFTFLAGRLHNLGFATVQFDYYKIKGQETITISYSKQAKILSAQIQQIRETDANKKIIIIAQSQGCLIPAMTDLPGVVKVIAISPFLITDKETVYKKYAAKTGGVTELTGISWRLHTDGTITVIPPEYWTERFRLDQYACYNDLGAKVPLTLIYGSQDPVMSAIDVKRIRHAKLISCNADHDFTGSENRAELWQIIEQEVIDISTNNQ